MSDLAVAHLALGQAHRAARTPRAACATGAPTARPTSGCCQRDRVAFALGRYPHPSSTIRTTGRCTEAAIFANVSRGAAPNQRCRRFFSSQSSVVSRQATHSSRCRSRRRRHHRRRNPRHRAKPRRGRVRRNSRRPAADSRAGVRRNRVRRRTARASRPHCHRGERENRRPRPPRCATAPTAQLRVHSLRPARSRCGARLSPGHREHRPAVAAGARSAGSRVGAGASRGLGPRDRSGGDRSVAGDDQCGGPASRSRRRARQDCSLGTSRCSRSRQRTRCERDSIRTSRTCWRQPGSESALLYVAVPPSLLALARTVASRAPVSVSIVATVRSGRSEPVGVPILDAQSLVKR